MSEELKRGIPKATVIGHFKLTKDEKEQKEKEIEIAFKELGFLEEEETLESAGFISTSKKD